MSKKGKRIILSICISVSIFLPFIVFVNLYSDAQQFPLTAQDVDIEMASRNVISFVEIQDSRVYVVYENGYYINYLYRISPFSNRFINFARFISRAGTIPGRWNNFRVYFNGAHIEYSMGDKHISARINRSISLFLAFCVFGSFAMYRTLLEFDRKRHP